MFMVYKEAACPILTCSVQGNSLCSSVNNGKSPPLRGCEWKNPRLTVGPLQGDLWKAEHWPLQGDLWKAERCPLQGDLWKAEHRLPPGGPLEG